MSEQIHATGSGHAAGGASLGDDSAESHKVRLAVAWTVVGVPLTYGIVSVLIRASQLFTQ